MALTIAQLAPARRLVFLLLAAASVGLAGCGSPNRAGSGPRYPAQADGSVPFYDPNIVSGDANTVTVSPSFGGNDASRLAVADAHCKRYGKRVLPTGGERKNSRNAYSYDCTSSSGDR